MEINVLLSGKFAVNFAPHIFVAIIHVDSLAQLLLLLPLLLLVVCGFFFFVFNLQNLQTSILSLGRACVVQCLIVHFITLLFACFAGFYTLA